MPSPLTHSRIFRSPHRPQNTFRPLAMGMFLMMVGFASLILTDRLSAQAPGAERPYLLVSSYDRHAAYLVTPGGQVAWKTEVPGVCQDAWLLEDGTVLTSGGNVVKVVRPDRTEVWKYVLRADKPVEIHGCQPLPGGGVVFGAGGLGRIIELDKGGKVVKEVDIPVTGNAHDQMRQVRKLPSGNFLVCAKGENTIYEFDPAGKPVRVVKGSDMSSQGLKWNALHSAERLANGNWLVGGGYESSLAEIDPAGQVVWNLTSSDVPEIGLTYVAGATRQPDGTTIVSAYHSKVPVFAVSADKKVLWKCESREIGHVTQAKPVDAHSAGRFLEAAKLAESRRQVDDASNEVKSALAAIDDLSREFPEKYAGAEFRKRIEESGQVLEKLRQLPAGDPGWAGADEAVRRFRAARREALFANPLLDFQNILFVKRDFLPVEERAGNHMCDQYFGFHATPGGGLFILKDAFSASPRTDNLLADSVCGNGRFKGKKLTADGGFLSPDLSFNGREIVFSYTEIGKPHSYEWTPEGTFHIFKVGIDGSHLTQLTDGPVNDIDPCFLPNGRLAFISERRGGFGRCHGRPVPVYTLHTMNSDGSDICCLSYHESNEWQPSVTNDGRIIYTRWDYVDRGFNQAHHPWVTTPDGRDPRALQGNYAANPHDRPMMEMDVRAVPNSRKFVATAAAHHGQAYGSLVVIDPKIEDDDKMASLTVVTPDVGFPEATLPNREGQKFATAWPLSEHFFLCVYDPEGSAGRGTSNRFGIYLIDSFGNRELLYSDPKISCLSPIPVKARPVPPVIPHRTNEGLPKQEAASKIRPDAGHGMSIREAEVVTDRADSIPDGMAKVGLVNVYDSLKPLPKDTPIRALRVIELLTKSTPIADQPRIGYGRQKNCRAILGTVPVEADGSAFFLAPIHRPIYFQALDDKGQAVQSMRSDTYFHAGEMLTCQGCHNSAYRAAPPKNSKPMAFRRPPSAIVPEVEGTRPFSFPILVQPVLDKNCVACHAEKKALDLSRGDWKQNPSQWFTSYANLKKFAYFYDDPVFTVPRTIPGQFGAMGSKLLKLIDGDHYGLRLSPEDRHRLVLWLDANSDFFGNFQQTEKQAAGEVVPIP